MENRQLKNILESILFVARQPLPQKELAEIAGFAATEVAGALAELTAEYAERGLRLERVAGGYLLGTAPENASYVEKILRPRMETTLSPQSLETLAIIAYKQPVTKAEIERLRGVDSGGVLDTLIAKKLIRELGRSDKVGLPYLYGTTEEFLRHFGLQDISSLPLLPATEAEQEALFKSALLEESASQ